MPLNVKWLGMNENNDGTMTVRVENLQYKAQNLHPLRLFKEFRTPDARKFSFYLLFLIYFPNTWVFNRGCNALLQGVSQL